MNENQVQAFTAKEIARAVLKPVRSLQRCLADVPPSTTVVRGGNATAAWRIAILPAKLQNQLYFKAAAQGYRTPEAMLSAPPKIWECPIPLAEVPAAAMEKATKWREALRPTWARAEAEASVSELARLGLEEFKRCFGYSITERQWRSVYERTMERDGGHENFERVELYLDAGVKAERQTTLPEEALANFSELEALMNRWPDRKNPGNASRRALWVAVHDLYQERVINGNSAKRLRRALLGYLKDRAPFLSKTDAGLRVTLGKILREGAPTRDGRTSKSGRKRGPELTPEEWRAEFDGFIAYTVANCGGRIAQSWREWLGKRLAHPKVILYYPGNSKDVPKRYIEAARTDVRILDAIHRSKSQYRANGAHMILDWTATWSNQAHCSDDVTFPCYFYEEDGQGWYRLQRGQCLLTIDVRSLRVLGFVLIPERNYNSFAIHTLYTRVWSEFGIPDIILHEGGIWDKARLLKGKQRREDEALMGEEIELGLREWGVKFRHSREARAKPVERVIGLLQAYMEREPGYCGRDEIRDRYDEVQALKKDVEAQRRSPVGVFHSRQQWEERLTEIIELYNAKEQDGRVLDGYSPDQAYERFQNSEDPPRKLEASCRYLLAHYRRPMKVTRNGITIRIGKNVFNYHSEETGRRIGETVLCWFNPEAPEYLTITDVRRRDPVCIARSELVPALDAPADLLEAESQKVAAHQGYGLQRYRILKTQFKQIFRKNVVDRASIALGAEMEAQQQAAREEKRRERRNSRIAAEIGFVLPQARVRTAEAGERLTQFKTALERLEEEAQKGDQP